MLQTTPTYADARPTREFFIQMITKDIPLDRAILDLVDNCLDGARRIRPDGNFEGLFVSILFDTVYFVVEDNCGGIPSSIARDYAFRFGRPPDYPLQPQSIGQFGVGMKRTIFKIGREFSVTSSTETSHFRVSDNVDHWLAQPDDQWHFDFTEYSDSEPSLEHKIGTRIEVTNLYPDISREFHNIEFRNRLETQLCSSYEEPMRGGLSITLNGSNLHLKSTTLLDSDLLKPAMEEIVFNGSLPPVTVKLIAGLGGRSSPLNAGWYVYCNGRSVIEADQSLLTGWGENRGKTIPRFHNQYSRFRGIVYMTCDDSSRLPWNTTKTGVDKESTLYLAVREKMILLMKPVIEFLNQVKEEKQDKADPRLGNAIDSADVREVHSISEFKPKFTIPTTERIRRPAEQTISYKRKSSDIDRVKAVLNVDTLKEVGEGTFDYFLSRECK